MHTKVAIAKVEPAMQDATTMTAHWTVTAPPFRYRDDHVSVALAPAICARGRAFLLATQDGPISARAIRGLVQTMRAQGAAIMGAPTLWDLRDHDFAGYDTAEFRDASFALRAAHDRRAVRRAFLVADGLGYGMVRMMYGLAEGLDLTEAGHVEVGYDAAALVAWVTGTRD